MPILHKVEQYSDAYDKLRLGLPTASKFDKIITPLGKPTKESAWQKYAYHLIAERVLQRPINTYTSPAMENGLLMEGDAVAYYEFETERDTALIGFVTTDDGKIGCSPDRLVGDDGLLECKCPQPQTQIEYLLTGKVDREYWPQLQGQLFVTGRQWVDIVSWHPELPRIVIRVERDVEYIACIEKLLGGFVSFMDTIMHKISTTINQKGIPDEYPQVQL